MTYYRDEKKRIGGSWKAFLILIIFFNFAGLMTAVTHNITGELPGMNGSGMEAAYIPFLNKRVCGGFVIVLFYLNYKLFFIKEQGENVFLPLKYEITPLTQVQMYAAKLGIMGNAAIAYLFACAGCYYFLLLARKYPVMDYGRSLLEIGVTSLITVGILACYLGFDILTHFRAQREL